MRPPSPEELQQALERLFGFAAFRPGQQEVAQLVMSGWSVLAVMPTGAGKSLCYQLPAALLPGCTLVLSPLIALMKDQADGLPPALAGRATVINSAVDGGEIDRRLRGIAAGRYRLVYAAPERLRHLPFLHALSRAGLSLFVVDEAHCVDMWGHDFRPDYAALGEALHALGRPTVLALTATATPATADAIEHALGVMLKRRVFGVCRPNLRLEVARCEDADARRAAVVRRCAAESGRGLLYARTRRETERLARLLRERGIAAAHYHAGMTAEERAAAQDRYQEGAARVLVATVAFGLGIDIPDIRFLLHAQPPDSLEAYAQEAGRAGRDGLPSRCTLYVTSADTVRLRRLAEASAPTLEALRAVYDAATRLLNGRTGQVALDDLRRETGLEAIPVRVALAWLEGAGLLRRHPDTPVSINMRRVRRPGPPPSGPPALLRLLESVCPADGSWNDAPAEALCCELGMGAEALEPFLLACQQEGWIAYRGSMREFTLERPRPPEGARAALERDLARYRAAQQERLRCLLGYVAATGCRHHHLAAHFACAAPPACAHCDNCRPEGANLRAGDGGVASGKSPVASEGTKNPALAHDSRLTTHNSTLTTLDVRRIILRCIAALPYALGRRGVTQLLRGAVDSPLPATRSVSFGTLRQFSREAVEHAIDALIEEGCLRVRQDGAYRLLTLTPAGARAAREAG